MTATDAQVRLMMKERSKGKTQEQSAAKANIRSRKTMEKYERLDKLPSEIKGSREYRTRPDPFEADWAEVEKKLEDAPECVNGLRQSFLEFSVAFLCNSWPDCHLLSKRGSCGKVDRTALPTFPQLLLRLLDLFLVQDCWPGWIDPDCYR
jgi:hypothetical protein